jgi:hypothetical protein
VPTPEKCLKILETFCWCGWGSSLPGLTLQSGPHQICWHMCNIFVSGDSNFRTLGQPLALLGEKYVTRKETKNNLKLSHFQIRQIVKIEDICALWVGLGQGAKWKIRGQSCPKEDILQIEVLITSMLPN